MLKIISKLLMSLATALIFSVLCGCTSTSAKMNHVRMGMTKTQLVREIGTPDFVSVKGNTEHFTYFWGNPKEYCVQLKNGRVDAYGEKDDSDSTNEPARNVNVQKQ
jgi:outer membrane protein assembly factor BamE (lipoprotein component of BamABCDE complex)